MQNIFLPPYSPDLMPSEEVFSKVKSVLKANDQIFQVRTAPRALLAMAFGLFWICTPLRIPYMHYYSRGLFTHLSYVATHYMQINDDQKK